MKRVAWWLIPLLLLGCGDEERLATEPGSIPDPDPGPDTVPVWTGPAPERGYQERSCGFDLDDDGVMGGAGDCDICDGTTTDPDGDGVDEDLIYIDCELGSDAAGCGAVATPCATIGYAWSQIADGPEAGAEDILCFRGVCTAEADVAPGVSGQDSVKVEPRSGTAERDFELPADPSMLVGWDSDDDGQYPPMDPDDVAVLDGGAGQLEYALTGLTSYLELAHFSARDYGRFNDSDHGGFVELKRGGAETTHVHMHDLVLDNINMDRDHVSGRITFNLFGGTEIRHLLFRNIQALNNGGYFVRGSAPWADGEDGPLRWQNLSLSAHGCDYSGAEACPDVDLANHTGWKVWGWVTGIEILDSVFDANTAAWEPKSSGGPPTNFVVANLCSRDWLIRNNLILNYKHVLIVDGYQADYCDNETARTVDDVVFDANWHYNDFDWGWGHHAVVIGEGGDSPGETIEDVVISNNAFYSTIGFESCFYLAGGNSAGPNPGTITVVHNSCVGSAWRFGAVVIGNPDGDDFPFPHAHYVIQNNLLGGMVDGDINVNATYAPQTLEMDGNVYDETGTFTWLGQSVDTLEAWQSAAAADAQSWECTPALVDAAAGDLHLGAADSCARSAGIDLSEITATDIDGDSRPLGAWDVGADELE